MSKRYSRSATLFFDVPLALLPAKRDEIIAFWETKLAGQSIDWDEHQEPFAAELLSLDGDESEGGGGKIAIIPIHGLISQRMNMMTAFSGGTSTDLVAQAFLDALHNPDIKSIVFDIDSPGGSTFGVTELANLIMESRGQKPIVAFANPVAASAAYWLGAAADHFFAEPSALVGSVGVYMVHTDLSKATESEGIKVTFISAGKNKMRGNEFEPLSDDDVTYLQTLVDDAYDMFVTDVARGRRVSGVTVLKNYGEGDVFTTSKAVKAGMIDGAKNSLSEVIASLGGLRPRRVVPRSLLGQAEEALAEGLVEKPGHIFGKPVIVEGEKWLFAGPIPPHNSPSIADDDAEWDAGKEVREAEGRTELRRMHVWVDDEADPDAKSSYKGPHHRANGQLVPRGLFALAARENQMDIPDGDHAGVRRHMARHYRELDRTPPWEEEEEQAKAKAWRLLQWQEQKARAEAFSVPQREEQVNGN